MKVNTAKKVTPLVGGRYRAGTAIATLFSKLAGGKPLTFGILAAAVRGKKVKDVKYRISRLRVHGRKPKNGVKWTLTRDGNTYKMKVVGKTATARTKRPTVTAKKRHTATPKPTPKPAVTLSSAAA